MNFPTGSKRRDACPVALRGTRDLQTGRVQTSPSLAVEPQNRPLGRKESTTAEHGRSRGMSGQIGHSVESPNLRRNGATFNNPPGCWSVRLVVKGGRCPHPAVSCEGTNFQTKGRKEVK